jgi:wyosine [tRNA(Phe)-imidazoG37] synthetase (radical SAM superfamily)
MEMINLELSDEEINSRLEIAKLKLRIEILNSKIEDLDRKLSEATTTMINLFNILNDEDPEIKGYLKSLTRFKSRRVRNDKDKNQKDSRPRVVNA